MKFTVLIPTHKNGVVIRAAIESVLEQTVEDFELFVVADDAPPETHALVKEYAVRDPRIRLFEFPKGERHGEAWRHQALEQARSDAVCYLSDDDFWFPDHLETMRGMLGDADFAHTAHTSINTAFDAVCVPWRLADQHMRTRLLTEKTNIFSITCAGHRLDAYRRLPVGWSPAPPDVWTDLNMWRKLIAADGMRFASSPAITTLHFSRGARASLEADASGEVFYWREVFRDPVMRDALRALFKDGKSKIALHEVAALAADLRLPIAANNLARLLHTKQDEIDQMRATKTWRYTQGLRSVWSRVRALRDPAPAPTPAPVAAPRISAPPTAAKMRVHLHTVCWNDMQMLPYFFRHYEPWVERFYFFDDGSTDGSREYLEKRNDVIVRRTPRSHPESWVLSAQTIHNSAWKRSIGEADWVVVTNVDEHLYHPDMPAYLAKMHNAGVTALPAPGYQMVTEQRPAPDGQLWRDHTFGAPDAMYSRMALFRPDRILETNYGPGRHRAQLQGTITFPERDEIANLHYKHLGVEQTHARQQALGAKLGAMDRAQGWGGQYYSDEGGFRAQFNEIKAASIDVSKVTEHNPTLCWWRT